MYVKFCTGHEYHLFMGVTGDYITYQQVTITWHIQLIIKCVRTKHACTVYVILAGQWNHVKDAFLYPTY